MTEPLLTPTPTVTHDDWRGTEIAFRMDAYYYSFSATGILAIDLILSAVACAGKAYHGTEQWADSESEPYHARLRGEGPIAWIQNAADDAAALIRAEAAAASVAKAREEERERCAQIAEGFDACDTKHIAAAIRASAPGAASGRQEGSRNG